MLKQLKDPGHTDPTAVEALERRIGKELPADYKDFLLEYDGGVPNPHFVAVLSHPDRILPIPSLFGVNDDIESCREYQITLCRLVTAAWRIPFIAWTSPMRTTVKSTSGTRTGSAAKIAWIMYFLWLVLSPNSWVTAHVVGKKGLRWRRECESTSL